MTIDASQSAPIQDDATRERVKPPELSWFPVRYIEDIARGRRPESWWLPHAESNGFRFVELHQSFVDEPLKVGRVEKALRAAGLGVAMITGASDLVHPLAKIRAQEIGVVRYNVDVAGRLGAPSVRITAGVRRDEVSFDQGLRWFAEAVEQLGPYADARAVKLCVENHFRDRTWPANAVDFAAEPARFDALYEFLGGTPVGINYDSSQPMVVDTDELAVFDQVAPRIFHVHLGDRLRHSRSHSVLGEGEVRLGAILGRLRTLKYDRFLSIEDGSPEGDVGLRRGLAFARGQIRRYWPEHGGPALQGGPARSDQ
jgi:sugar phosphate isomerase/epimerase